jgi:hypothetical protein
MKKKTNERTLELLIFAYHQSTTSNFPRFFKENLVEGKSKAIAETAVEVHRVMRRRGSHIF